MMTAFQELIAVPVSTDAVEDPCVEISREGVACPDGETLAPEEEAAEDSAAFATRLGYAAFAAIFGTALIF
jgi:hypothetical protein